MDRRTDRSAGSDATGTEPYPRDLERRAILDDGTALWLRPIRPDDEAGLEDLHSRLSEQTSYQRFFTAVPRLPSSWARYLANVDYRRRLAVVAERDVADGFELIGVGRYDPTSDDGIAEVAFVVEDGWQGRGLGEMLLQEVLAAAEARGIRRFRAVVLAGNHRMLRLLDTRTDVLERKLEAGIVELVFTRAAAGEAPR